MLKEVLMFFLQKVYSNQQGSIRIKISQNLQTQA